MNSRRQKLLTRVNWYLQPSLNTLLNKSQVTNFIKEVVVTDRFHCINEPLATIQSFQGRAVVMMKLVFIQNYSVPGGLIL